MDATVTTYRTCPLCEATCGLEITTAGDEVLAVRPDHDDVFSHGFICPKGVGLKELHDDPDRLRTPLLRRADGSFAPATWDEAFAEIDRRLPPILEAHGRDAVGAYLGNPTAHNLAPVLYGRALLRALGSKNVFSASTVDQMPKQVSAGLMFGGPFRIPVPDLDRTGAPADPRRQSAGLQRQPHDRPGRPRPPAWDPGARRQGRRVRPAPQPDRRGGRRAPLHPARDRCRTCSSALVHVLFDEDLASPGVLADAVQRPRRGA